MLKILNCYFLPQGRERHVFSLFLVPVSTVKGFIIAQKCFLFPGGMKKKLR